MKKALFGFSLVCAMAVGANAAESYKITKTTGEGDVFSIVTTGADETSAESGTWVTVVPAPANGKIVKSIKIFKADGRTPVETTIEDNRFVMPEEDVVVQVNYMTLRFYLKGKVNNSEQGSVSFSIQDEHYYTDRAKKNSLVTVIPQAKPGFKVAEVKVTKYLDSKTSLVCESSASNGECSFAMPPFDVNVNVTFVPESQELSSSSVAASSSSTMKVDFDLDGGRFAEDPAKEFSCGAVSAAPVPLKDGASFIGWTAEKVHSNIYGAVDYINGYVCQDATLHAWWMNEGSCPDQKAIEVAKFDDLPTCNPQLNCALFHVKDDKDYSCNGMMWMTAVSSSSAESSSSVASSSSEKKDDSSSSVASSSSEKKDDSSSSVASSSSEKKDDSSSSVASSSSEKKDDSSSSVASSSSEKKDDSSSSVKSSSSSKKKDDSSSSVKSSSSSKKKDDSSSSVKSSSSSKKKDDSSSSVKSSSSSKKKDDSSSSVTSSSSINLEEIETVATEEDLVNCTSKRSGLMYFIKDEQIVVVCKDKSWVKMAPEALPTIAKAAHFNLATSGREILVSGARVGESLALFDMQGRVIYSGRVQNSNTTLSVSRAGRYMVNIGGFTQVISIK